MKSLLRLAAAVAFGLVVVAGCLGLLSRLLAGGEQRFEGGTVEGWCEALTNTDTALKATAQRVVRDVVVPSLSRQIVSDTNDLWIRVVLVDLIDQLPGFNIDFMPATTRRLQAITQLGSLGPAAGAAIPTLLGVLKGPEESFYENAAKSLVQIGAPAETAVPALLAVAVSAEGAGRADVVEALGDYGPAASSAVRI